MTGKYDSRIRFFLARSRNRLLRALLRRLFRWGPIADPEPGYSVVLGCATRLGPILCANLDLLARQDRTHLRQLIVVLDRSRAEFGTHLEEELLRRHEDLPLRFLYYSRWQSRLLATIDWGWCYSWLSWCLGIAAAPTRYVILHDFDAMLLRPSVLEERFRTIAERGHQFLGCNYYQGNGVVPEDRLVTTCELVLDAEFLRRNGEPIDLFNYVGFCGERTVNFDTLLHAQYRFGKRSVLSIDHEDMVHPSQLICQFTESRRQRHYTPPEANNLLLIPYFLYLGGEGDVLREQQVALERAEDRTISFLGRPVDCSRLSRTHADWLWEQGLRLERGFAGEIRPEVSRYLGAIRDFVDRTAHTG